MQKVLTAEQIREVDRLTTERYGIPSILLMENAAHAVARVITEKLGGSVKGKSILILCGTGNNGGNGAALARILWKDGALVVPLIFGRVGETSRDARVNFEILQKVDEGVLTSGGGFNKLLLHDDDEDLTAHVDGFLSTDGPKLVVDALFGTGLTRELSGVYLDIIQRLKNHQAAVVAIDIPSGINADKSELIGQTVFATCTVTFTAPKLGNVVPPASNRNGELIVANIGSPQELIGQQPSQLYFADFEDVSRWLTNSSFSVDSYKNKRGHALIVAGSAEYSGAAVLAGNATMRSGVGLVTLATPRSIKESVAARSLPDVIVRSIDETADGEVSPDAFADSSEMFDSADVIAVGCGLSAIDAGVEKLVREIVENRKTPVIVDAGALWFFSPYADRVGSPHLSNCLSDDGSTLVCPLIVTPHEGEFLRLLGTGDKDAIKDRVAAVREFATANNLILVLKGERVLIGEPGGKVVVNPTGNSGLGKAGNGDMLTGILAGFVAQAARMKIDIFETVVAAVYIAGLAGDIAEKKYGKRVMTASDVRECLVEAFEMCES